MTFSVKDASEAVVVIDPGHGGEDPGALGNSGAVEKSLNLDISQRLNDLLGFFGVNTQMTRETDISLHSPEAEIIRQKKVSDIKNRVKQVNETQNATLLSVHMNSFPQSIYKGAQVFYSPNNAQGKPLAEAVQTALKSGLDGENERVAKPAGKSIYLLSNVNCPAILVECGFLSNPQEESQLQEEGYQKKVALSITAGYLNFCRSQQSAT